jgi:hypothetical protein
MSNTTTATITGVSLVIAERNDLGLVCETVAVEARPATLAEADKALAFYSLGRTGAWDLDDNGGVAATVVKVDNRFNGVPAARLEEAVGTTHAEFELALASTVENGDLVTDSEFSEVYLVAGSSTECGMTKLHMIREGGTWADRHTGEFAGLIQVARKR